MVEEKTTDPVAKAHLMQRCSKARLILQCDDAPVQCKFGAGTLPGDTVAGGWFLGAYHECLDLYAQRAPVPELVADLPWLAQCKGCEQCDSRVDVSMGSYADDVLRFIIATGADQMYQRVQKHSFEFQQALERNGFAHNDSNKFVIPKFCGKNSAKHTRWAIDTFAVRAHRYLGPIINDRANMSDERWFRLSAMRRAFAMLGKVWSRSLARRWSVVLLKSMVLGSALSGLVAFAPGKQEVEKFDAQYALYLRRLLRGHACDKDHDGHKKAMSNKEVHRITKTVPVSVELRVQRIKWWQRIVSKPRRYVQWLCACFGTFAWDQHPPLDEEGCVTPTAHPWAQFFCDDVAALAEASQNESLLSVGRRVRMLFLDAEVHEAFVKADPDVIRSQYTSVSIPPGPVQGRLQQQTETEQLEGFLCGLQRADGSICGIRFKDRHTLVLHRVKTKGGEHGSRNVAFVLIRTNQCLGCGAVLRSRRIAQHHFESSVIRGHCKAVWSKGSATQREVIDPGPGTCCVCGEELPDLDCSNFHLSKHIPELFPEYGVELE